MSNKMLKAALKYQQLGYFIIPLHSINSSGCCTCSKGIHCHSSGKHPRIQNGVSEATNNIDIITKWFSKYPNSNIGLATGRINNIIAIDVDIKHEEGKTGDYTIIMLQDKLGKLPETVEQLTGSGGIHYLFKYPNETINNSVGIADFIDVRSDNGYIVVSPSIHKSGKTYEWEISSRIDEIKPAILPNSWVEFLRKSKKEKSEKLVVEKKFSNGTRNDNMFKVCCSLHSQGYSKIEIKSLLDQTNKIRCEPPLEEQEILEIIKNVTDRYEAGEFKQVNEEKQEEKKETVLEFPKEYCVFVKNKECYKPLNIQKNIELLLNHYNIYPQYNEMTKSLDVCIPGRCFTKDNNEELVLQYIYNKALIHGFSGLNKDLIKSIILDIGDNKKHSPVVTYIDKCYSKHKNEPETEIDKILNSLKTPENFSVENKRMLITKWLISCCEAAYSKNGIAAQGILILQGQQGYGKTTFFRNLFANIEDSFGEGLTLDPNNKDSVSRAVAYWVCELGEIESTFRKDIDVLKSYVTNNTDVLRKPYARGTSYYPRRTVFCGTVNGAEYLKDDTGNRRFWTIPIDSIENIPICYEKLWCEVRKLHLDGVVWWMDKKEMSMLNETNKNFEQKNYIDTLIQSSFLWDKSTRYELKIADIFNLLGQKKELSSTKIGQALNKMEIPYKINCGYKIYEMPMHKDFVNYTWNFKTVDGIDIKNSRNIKNNANNLSFLPDEKTSPF